MLAELSEFHPVVHETFLEASDGAGVDLWALSQGGPEEMLNRTEYTNAIRDLSDFTHLARSQTSGNR